MKKEKHIKCKCGKYASYGFNKRTHCSFCKEDGMKDINNYKKICNCGKYATFGYKKATHCKSCKEASMIDIINKYKKCKCGKRCSFGYEKATHCNDCKESEMKNVLKHIKCKCGKRPSFGIINKSPSHCKNCKTEFMVDLRHIYCKCGKRPSYGYIKSTHCNLCKEDDMIDINNKNKKCVSEFCNMLGSKKYSNYCTHCFANLFPSDERTLKIRKKSKELKVISHIGNLFEDWIHDKPLYVDIKGGCCNSKRRIDLRKLINGTMLCIEIDEKQHKYYNKKDEQERYDNLFMDFSGKWIFIRYNPDKYKLNNNRIRNPFFDTRMKILEHEINNQIFRIKNEKNKEIIEIHYLFFDEQDNPCVKKITT